VYQIFPQKKRKKKYKDKKYKANNEQEGKFLRIIMGELQKNCTYKPKWNIKFKKKLCKLEQTDIDFNVAPI